MIDETLLDTPRELTNRDPRGLLRSAAAAGAQVRTAALAADGPLDQLTPEGRPSSVLLASPGPEAPLAAGLLAALGDGSVRVTTLTPTGPTADPGTLRWPLPRWAGPLDLLLITTADGSEPGLTDLLERAYRRGCAVATVAPLSSSLAGLTVRRRSLTLELTTAPHTEPPGHPAAPGPYWSQLTPLLLLAGRLGVSPTGPADLRALADRLDRVAERCGPVTPAVRNPAKTLATGLDGGVPLLWSDGPLATTAARHAAATLHALAAVPALTASLPGALTQHTALLTGDLLHPAARDSDNTALDDFFRDRVEEPPPVHARIVLLSGEQPADPTAPEAIPAPAPSALPAARELASRHGRTLLDVETTPGSGPLEATAELIGQLDFTAVYLALTAGTAT